MENHPMSRHRTGLLRSLFLTSILAAAAAACGPGTSTLPTALPMARSLIRRGRQPPLGTTSPLPSGALTDPAEAWPAFAACLRSHGLQVADPEVDDNGDPVWATDIKQGITRRSRPTVGRSSRLSRRRGRTAATDPGYTYKSELAHATCMREHGLPIGRTPTPTTAKAACPRVTTRPIPPCTPVSSPASVSSWR